MIRTFRCIQICGSEDLRTHWTPRFVIALTGRKSRSWKRSCEIVFSNLVHPHRLLPRGELGAGAQGLGITNSQSELLDEARMFMSPETICRHPVRPVCPGGGQEHTTSISVSQSV